MEPFVIQILGFAFMVFIVYTAFKKRNPLDNYNIPGPKPYPFIGNVLQLNTKKIFHLFD